MTDPNPIDQVYELCKLQAQTDGAFPEPLLRAWFEAAWQLCADMIDLVPPQEIKEPISVDSCGNFRLSYRPNGLVEILEGYQVIAVVPRPLDRTVPCFPALCCLCHPHARYRVGHDQPCGGLPPRFVQAFARLFAYMVENRGDSELDEAVLGKCGAKVFLSPDLTYAL